MSDRREPQVARQDVDIKLCPTNLFKGERAVLVQDYDAFNAAAANRAVTETYEENFPTRKVAEITKRA